MTAQICVQISVVLGVVPPKLSHMFTTKMQGVKNISIILVDSYIT